MVFPVKIQSSGKVELNSASTPSLECLRRKLSEDSLIWLSKCLSTDEITPTLPRWYFRQCEHSRSLIRRRESCLFINSKKNPVKNLQLTAPKAKNRQNFAGGWPPGMFIEAWGYTSMVFPVKIQSFGKVELQQSLFGKVEPDSKTIGRNFELTINVDHLESVEMSGQRQSFTFSISEKSSSHAGFSSE